MCSTTSTIPTTAIDRESTTARTPAACIRAPAHPKKSASGFRSRIASTTREAYRSPEASPAETKMRTRSFSVPDGDKIEEIVGWGATGGVLLQKIQLCAAHFHAAAHNSACGLLATDRLGCCGGGI